MAERADKSVSLEEVLRARELRRERQQQALRRFGRPMVSFTMNIPGPVKDTPLTRLAFRAGLRRLEEQLGPALYVRRLYPATGSEALLVYDRPAPELKKICLAIEGAGPVGRLYDLDVFDARGEKLSRDTERSCLICGGPVRVCARSRAHGLAVLQQRTEEILRLFAAEHLAALAETALLEEAMFTPKPGLVDQRNTGAHTDMDLSMFVRSARTLAPFFREFVLLGAQDVSPAALQSAGKKAEEHMFAATGGVNTHKGAVYSLALLLSAAGRALCVGGELLSAAADTARALPLPEGTNGSSVRRRYGVGGAREEAVRGFPSAIRCCEVLEKEGALAALLWNMAHVADTNLYHRGGAEGAAYVRREAAAVLGSPEAERLALTEALDDRLIARDLSPGGSADIFALALFLRKLKGVLDKETFCLGPALRHDGAAPAPERRAGRDLQA